MIMPEGSATGKIVSLALSWKLPFFSTETMLPIISLFQYSSHGLLPAGLQTTSLTFPLFPTCDVFYGMCCGTYLPGVDQAFEGASAGF